MVLSVLGSMLALVIMSGSVYGSSPAARRSVRVQPGDTVWSIAVVQYPGDDVRGRVADIEVANHLPGPVLVAGQDLVLPSG